MIGRVKKWASFQHYKDRSPPWIKLHRELLDDYEYACLPLASKALAPMLWLLAAESNDGAVRIDSQWIAFRLRWNEADVVTGLNPLIANGFIIPDGDVASTVLAECKQLAIPEGEGETEVEREEEYAPPLPATPAAPPSPVAIEVPMTGGRRCPITEARLARYGELYPGVDLLRSLRKMVGWLEADTRRQSATERGVHKRIASWLGADQDRPPRPQVGSAATDGRSPAASRPL